MQLNHLQESSDSDSEGGHDDDESDFMLSDSNAEDNESDSGSSIKASSSENEDYNPFGDFSDSDDDGSSTFLFVVFSANLSLSGLNSAALQIHG